MCTASELFLSSLFSVFVLFFSIFIYLCIYFLPRSNLSQSTRLLRICIFIDTINCKCFLDSKTVDAGIFQRDLVLWIVCTFRNITMTSNNQEFENINFKCISLNVRGLNKSRKRRKIFRWLHQQNAQIVLLQETYSTKKGENKWKTEWVGQMLFSHGSNHSKGVMILIKPSFDIEIKRSIQDKQGRCIILEAKVYESNFIFVNIYAPNDCTHQMIFYKSLQERLKKFSNENLVIGGDFNCVLSSLDKKGGKPASEKIRVTNEIQRTMALFNLHDAWRDLFPEQIGFTWRDNALKVQSRLDYFLVSKQLKPIICYCDIIFAPFTDHSAVTLQIRTKDCQQKKGPGFWKFNSSLLIDNKYVESLRACIAKSKTKYEYLENKGLKWNLIKMEIRAFSIRFSKKKAKLKRTEEKTPSRPLTIYKNNWIKTI